MVPTGEVTEFGADELSSTPVESTGLVVKPASQKLGYNEHNQNGAL